jgi:hypothetical protein
MSRHDDRTCGDSALQRSDISTDPEDGQFYLVCTRELEGMDRICRYRLEPVTEVVCVIGRVFA